MVGENDRKACAAYRNAVAAFNAATRGLAERGIQVEMHTQATRPIPGDGLMIKQFMKVTVEPIII